MMPNAEWFGVLSPVLLIIFSGAILIPVSVIISPEKQKTTLIIISLLGTFISAGIDFVLVPYIYTQQLPMGAMFVYDRFAAICHYIIIFACFCGCLITLLEKSNNSTTLLNTSIIFFITAACMLLSATADLWVIFICEITVILASGFIYANLCISEDSKGNWFWIFKFCIILVIFIATGVTYLTAEGGSSNMWDVSNEFYAILSAKKFAAGKLVADSTSWGFLIAALSVIITPFLLSIALALKVFAKDRIEKNYPGVLFVLWTGLITGGFAIIVRMQWFFFTKCPIEGAGKTLKTPIAICIMIFAFVTIVVSLWKMAKSKSWVEVIFKGCVAHCGFILLPLAGMSRKEVETSLIYLIGVVLTCGSNLILIKGLHFITSSNNSIARKRRKILSAFWKSSPVAFVILCIQLFSFAGLPGTVGFTARYKMFEAMLRKGGAYGIILPSIAISATILMAYIYIRNSTLSLYHQNTNENLLHAHKNPACKPSGKTKVLLGLLYGICVLMTLAIVAGGISWKILDDASKWAMLIIEYEY